MSSLFIVSLPRSLSTHVYRYCRDRLGLAEPRWTSDGEVLNLDRYVLLPEEGAIEGIKFIRQHRDPQRFRQLIGFLDQVIQPEGFIYKDVVQPFVLAQWFRSSGPNVVKIERPVADVAYSMLERDWVYPRLVASEIITDKESAVLDGLLEAQRAIATIPGPTLLYDDLIQSESELVETLRTLGYDAVARPKYVDEDFRNVREEVLLRRETARYNEIEERIRDLSQKQPFKTRPPAFQKDR